MTTFHNSSYRRHRKAKYSLKPIVLGVVAIAIVYWIGTYLVSLLSFSNQEVASILLQTNTPEQISILLDNEWKQNVNDIKLYESNAVKTNNGFATLQFTNGDQAYIDKNSEITIEKSTTSETEQLWNISLKSGQIYIASVKQTTPTSRVVSINDVTVTIPDETDVLISPADVSVLEDTTIGVNISTPTMSEPIYIGEGQVLQIPDTGLYTIAADNYVLRSVYKGSETNAEFLALRAATNSGATNTPMLTITEPVQNAVVTGNSVTVTGTVSSAVRSVLINNVVTTISNASFKKNVTITGSSSTITITAQDATGEVVASESRVVTRELVPANAPVVTSPLPVNGVIETSQSALKVSGTVAKDTKSIQINDYTLQLYKPGSLTWQYIADSALGNLKDGDTTLNITATNNDGQVSPVTTVIIRKTASAKSQNSTSTLSQGSSNSITGSLEILKPSTSGTYTTNESEILIEGVTKGGIATVSVNDYVLQLYNTKNGVWNYKASQALGTMKAGENVYTITAKNADGTIVDSKKFTITYTPAE